MVHVRFTIKSHSAKRQRKVTEIQVLTRTRLTSKIHCAAIAKGEKMVQPINACDNTRLHFELTLCVTYFSKFIAV